RERLRAPLSGEVAASQRRTLAAVVPAAERGDENRAAELRSRGDDQLRHSPSLVRSDGAPQSRDEPDRPGEEQGPHRDVDDHHPTRDRANRGALAPRRPPTAPGDSRAPPPPPPEAREIGRAETSPGPPVRGTPARTWRRHERASRRRDRTSRAAARRP